MQRFHVTRCEEGRNLEQSADSEKGRKTLGIIGKEYELRLCLGRLDGEIFRSAVRSLLG